MIAHTLTERHPWHQQETCVDCAGAGQYFCANPPFGPTIETCPRCGGRGSIYKQAFDPNCDKCRNEQYQHSKNIGV